MADYLSIPRLNVLRFARTDNQSGNMQNFDNRLLHQEVYDNTYERPYYQKFNVADPILIQITTNYSTKTIEIYDAILGTKTDLTANWVTIESFVTVNDGTVTVYNNTVITTTLAGYYYIKITFNSPVIYQSEYFHVGSYSDYVKVKWTHSELGQYKGIYFSGVETFQFRLDSRLIEMQPGINKSIHESFNAKLENLTADVKRYVILELDTLPRYIIEKLYVMLQVDSLQINDVYYQTEEGATIEFVKEGIVASNMYTGQLKLREVSYEIYDELEQEEEIETFYLLINETEDVCLINATDLTLIQ